MINESAKISIVLPVYNVASKLRGCLGSLIKQTLNQIEIICVDDASTDDSLDILEEYALRDKRIRIIRYETNRSASQARKDGALAATGEYVMFLDADDYLAPEACEQLYEQIRKHGAEILQFGTQIINEGGVPKDRLDNLKGFLKPYPGRIEGPEVFEACFRHGKFGFTIWNKIYSSDLCRRAFLHVPDGSFPKAQDLLAYFILAFFARSYVGVESAIYYNYRFGAGITGHNQMSLNQFKTHCTQARVPQGIRHFLEEQGVFDKYQVEYQKIHENLLFECVWNWLRHLAPNDQGRGYDLLVEAWGADAVASCLVWPREYDKIRAALTRAREENTAVRQSLAEARKETAIVRQSWSFRLGYALLFLPGKICGWWNRVRR